MARISRLFAIERDIKERLELMAEQQGHPMLGTAVDAVRLEIRQLRTVPELEALRHFLDEQKKEALPKSPWGQAVNYALNQWEDLSLFTKLGVCVRRIPSLRAGDWLPAMGKQLA